MVDVASALLSAFLQVLFDRMANRKLFEFFGRNNIDQVFHKLKILLLSVNAVLGDAEDKQITDPFVKSWLDELKEAVYDAENVLDLIATKALQPTEDNGVLSQVTDTVSSFNPFIDGMKSKLERINERLSSIVQHKDLLGLKEGNSKKLPSLSMPTTCLIDEHQVYGRQLDTYFIVDLLLSREEHVSVIAIVGMAGMGKTTLTQIVYNHPRVKNHFEITLWVHISEGSDVFEVTKKIYDSLLGSNTNILDLNTLQTELQEKLRGKKFLIVLDDYWAENFLDWDLLKRPLQSGYFGSSIIVTTRNKSVALTMQAVEIYFLPCLSDEDCWQLFAQRAFRTRDPEATPTLKEIGEKIVRKCKGHPLAVKTLGSLLAYEDKAKDWNKILQSKMWDLPANKSNILPALRLSYQHLPGYLKRCFAYCSIFPKGREISKWDLIHLWMAEGLLPPPKNAETMLEVGQKYFHELLSRSFLQSNGSSFIMHDLISDLAQHIGGEFFHKLERHNLQQFPEKARHLSLALDMFDDSDIFADVINVSKLRTFLPFTSSNLGRSRSAPEAFFNVLLRSKKLIHLRVLSLSYYPIIVLPNLIGDLKHLRYLNLSHTLIEQLPDSVGSLYNLETLLLSGCGNLTILPENLQKLTNLRRLDIGGTNLSKMPPNFSKLKHLQLLTTFFASSENGSRLSELGPLSKLHSALSIVGLNNVNYREAYMANLKEKEFLDDLELKWTDGVHNLQNERMVLENLQPHENLKMLKIENYGGRMFPDWLVSSSFSNMASLHLICCRNCSTLPSLGQLPNLKMLHIANMTSLPSVGPEFFGNHTRPFRSLETLMFVDMDNWETWLLDDGSEFPSLQVFHIQRCPRLNASLPEVPLLQELVLIGCSALVSLPEECISLTLKSLNIRECGNLELFSHEQPTWRYQALEHLHIESSCANLMSFPLSMFTAALIDLHIQDCGNLESVSLLVPQLHQDLRNLKHIEIKDCPRLASFPEGGLPTPNLQSLSISNCVNMTPRIEWGLHTMASLTSFTIQDGSNDLQNFPVEGLLPASLTSLKIYGLQNLRSLNQTGFQHLTSLECVKIFCCNVLEFLPELGFPASLSSLTIFGCPLLVPLCQRDTGPYWHLISELQYLDIDGDIIIGD